MKRLLALFTILFSVNCFATWDDMTTAAATGYCLANHPYHTIHVGEFTPDGYETVANPGIVGAVRRNFIAKRTTKLYDEGNDNTCAKACTEFGSLYKSPRYQGATLRKKVAGGRVINDGIGDMASLAQKDYDFYRRKVVTAGIWSRGNNFHESDVGQSDFCCCQLK